MVNLDFHASGRHFLQIPGPTPVPDRILRAISLPTIDHRGPEFAALGLKVLEGLRGVFKTKHPVIVYSSSGTGAWEAALVNLFSPGDHLVMYETGYFTERWATLARRLGLAPELLGPDNAEDGFPEAPRWRRPVDPALIEHRLRRDVEHRIKGVCIVHNETSTGALSDIAAVRRAIDASRHPALLLVDVVSSLACADYRHDEWGVDVAIAASQKGLMLPPGLGFNALSAKAVEAAKSSLLPRCYWSWDEIIEMNRGGVWPYTPNTNLLYGLSEALDMLGAEGLDRVFARHQRWGAGVRAAVQAWGLEVQATAGHSPVVTGVLLPKSVDAEALRKLILERFDVSLGPALGKLKGRMFRIGHLGSTNDLTLIAALAACEMGMTAAGVNLAGSGVQMAMDRFARS